MSLQRFHQAQASHFAGYDVALEEVRLGRKACHWIWYIFPQLAGLGHSSTACHYAIRELDEAREFLRDSTLRARFCEIAAAVRDQLDRGIDIETLMSSRLDALKLISSVTLFRAAARTLVRDDPAFQHLATLCHSILAAAETKGYSPCGHTLAQIGKETENG